MKRTSENGNRLVSITNGIEFLLIPRTELAAAIDEGYYRPSDCGKTVVSRDGKLFEVSVEKSGHAKQEGYKDLLARERPAAKQSRSNRISQAGVATPQRSRGREQNERLSKEVAPVVSETRQPPEKENPSKPVVDKTVDETADDPSLLIESVEECERQSEEEKLALEREIAEQTGWRHYWLIISHWLSERRAQIWKQFGTSGISAAFHLAIFLILAGLYIAQPEPEKNVIVASISDNEEMVEEITIETEPIEITEPTETEPEESAPSEVLAEELEVTTTTTDFLTSIASPSIKPPQMGGKPDGDSGDGIGKTVAKPTVFGSKFAAINNVFVIDNSNSMTGGRFETALLQLMLTVDQFSPKQRFYVIFYSDTAYGLFHPRTSQSLVPATSKNKQLLRLWLNTVPLCLKTNGKEAIRQAFSLKPDVVYILGDGAFTDKAAQFFTSKPNKSVVIHTLGMQVKPNLAAEFRKLATAHRGTYRDVGVMEQGAILAKRYPRPRNNSRGPIWGITLPLKKKK